MQIYNVANKWRWKKDPLGIFQHGFNENLLQNLTPHSSFILHWNNWVPTKANIFGRKVEKDIIATKLPYAFVGSNLTLLSILSAMIHLLISWFYAIWHLMPMWCNISPIFEFHVKDVLELHKTIKTTKYKKIIHSGYFFTACWNLLKARNDKVFENKKNKLIKRFQCIKSLSLLG